MRRRRSVFARVRDGDVDAAIALLDATAPGSLREAIRVAYPANAAVPPRAFDALADAWAYRRDRDEMSAESG